MADPKPVVAERVRVPERDVTLAEHGRQGWHVTARGKATIEDAQHPAFLWHAHRNMRPGDMVEIVHEHGRFEVWLRIVKVDTDTQSVLSRTLNVWDFTADPEPLPDLSAATVQHMGEAGKWTVISGTETLSSGHATEKAAREWLRKKATGS